MRVNTQTILVGVGIAAGLYFLLRGGVAQAASNVKGVTTGEIIPEDSPYRNSDGDPIGGVAASAGAATDAVTGGLLSRFGSFLGGAVNDTVNRIRGTGSYQGDIAK